VLGSDDLASHGYDSFPGITLSIVGVDNWDPSPDGVWDDPEPRHPTTFEQVGGVLDLAAVRASLDGTTASIVWFRASRDAPPQVDIRNVADLSTEQIRTLWRARKLVTNGKALGRALGVYAYTEDEFRAEVTKAVRHLERNRQRVTHEAVARMSPMSRSAYYGYKRRWPIRLAEFRKATL
jgi:hypothetical protein